MTLIETLKSIDVMKIPVMSRHRSISLREQAKLARQLFKQLGIKGLSVRVANGANCFYVYVRFPKTKVIADDQYIHMQLKEILSRAFPQHDDRSDTMTDYFDRCWLIWPTP